MNLVAPDGEIEGIRVATGVNSATHPVCRALGAAKTHRRCRDEQTDGGLIYRNSSVMVNERNQVQRKLPLRRANINRR